MLVLLDFLMVTVSSCIQSHPLTLSSFCLGAVAANLTVALAPDGIFSKKFRMVLAISLLFPVLVADVDAFFLES